MNKAESEELNAEVNEETINEQVFNYKSLAFNNKRGSSLYL